MRAPPQAAIEAPDRQEGEEAKTKDGTETVEAGRDAGMLFLRPKINLMRIGTGS